MVSFTTSLEFSCLHFQDNFLCKDIRTLSYVTRNFYQMGWYILTYGRYVQSVNYTVSMLKLVM